MQNRAIILIHYQGKLCYTVKKGNGSKFEEKRIFGVLTHLSCQTMIAGLVSV